MFKRTPPVIPLLLLTVFLFLSACNGDTQTTVPEATPDSSSEVAIETATSTSSSGPQEPSAAPEQVVADVARAGAEETDAAYYIARLPRPADVPEGWLMDRTPQYEARSPLPGDTYRYACQQLPSRSIGLASVGYRSLDALPSLTIEYVIYPSAADAAAALAEMRQATGACPEFAISSEPGAEPNARLSLLDFPSLGESSFGAMLATSTEVTGDLVTHVIKIQEGSVVVGINHANWGDQPPPNREITERIAELALQYLGQ